MDIFVVLSRRSFAEYLPFSTRSPRRGLRLEIKLSVRIERPVEAIFDFLSDFQNHHQERNSKVIQVEELTSDRLGVGATYREIVGMMPFIHAEMVTVVTRFEPHEWLEFKWSGGGLEGVLEYHLQPLGASTQVEFRERITTKGIMVLASPIIHKAFRNTMLDRLQGIKQVLEGSR
jgi:hypothetical protein